MYPRAVKGAIPALLLSSALVPAYGADSLEEAITGGDAKLQFRYRFEHVDQDGLSKDAGASTLKSRISYKTLPYKNWSFFVEADDVTYLGGDNFNNTRNGETRYPVVADPDGTHINQAYANYAGDKFNVRIGRQRVNLDNQRFVGGVGWRQNEQTYDAVTISTSAIENTTIVYGYVNRVSRIFGPDKGTPADKLDTETHLLNIKVKLSDATSLTAYAYAMDVEDADAVSNQTLGIRFSHKISAGDASIPLAFEYAVQDDHGDNPTNYSANYLHATVGYNINSFRFGIGHEVLEGNDDPGESFRTPLATLHAFNGWTDKFLATPNSGIEDTYFKFGYKTFNIVYHDFDAETGSSSLGSEVGVSWAHKFNDHYSLLLKAADYSADDHATDTKKAWVMFTATF